MTVAILPTLTKTLTLSMACSTNRRPIALAAFGILTLALVLNAGCRINMPARSPSNLWARTVEDRADWHLCNMGQAPNPTHRSKVTSDWTKGYYRGYQDAAFAVNALPPSQYPAVWSPQRNNRNSDDQAIQAGYNAGFQQASDDGLINSVPLKQ